MSTIHLRQKSIVCVQGNLAHLHPASLLIPSVMNWPLSEYLMRLLCCRMTYSNTDRGRRLLQPIEHTMQSLLISSNATALQHLMRSFHSPSVAFSIIANGILNGTLVCIQLVWPLNLLIWFVSSFPKWRIDSSIKQSIPSIKMKMLSCFTLPHKCQCIDRQAELTRRCVTLLQLVLELKHWIEAKWNKESQCFSFCLEVEELGSFVWKPLGTCWHFSS